MNKSNELQTAWNNLMGIDKRHYVPTGFYALGDAYLISGKNPVYRDKVVIVEYHERTQINHWNWTILKADCAAIATITTNGDDGQGNLKRKAPSLNILS